MGNFHSPRNQDQIDTPGVLETPPKFSSHFLDLGIKTVEKDILATLPNPPKHIQWQLISTTSGSRSVIGPRFTMSCLTQSGT
ncbi:hypothetical protein ScalyP_jg8571 [Parmales sp. scaly parma]|nr:hypothetical protein ScalyP_jg8571 [Parmales sp. scaly parma]